VLALALVASGGLAFAQAPPEGNKKDDAIKAILEQEMEVPPGAYTYNPQGRRDPFVSLLKPVGPAAPGERPHGMEGFLIQEVALKGIVKSEGSFIAMLQGTDGKSYFCKVGQRLFDGQIVAMDKETVTFRQDVTDPLSSVKTRELKKTLYPSEEARQ
jgi:type IV pilus assembly protein PilP